MTSVREEIAELLGGMGASGSFAARRTADPGDLAIEVTGEGRLRFPVSRAQAKRLSALARPARFGRGEETLLDRDVRDTWEVPKRRVKIDRRRWNRALAPALDAFRAELGLPDGCRLHAELHSMLVYGPGQFFRRHQDSEKADDMVGTLVVTLPSSFRGGSLVVEHRGERASFRGSKKHLSLVAFYADCHHEVRPVTDGYRITLAYNLTVEGGGIADRTLAAAADPATVDGLAERLTEYFETPAEPRYAWQRDDPPRDPPDRLVFLLDHQYTERGLGWKLLKGEDGARVAALRAAAESAGCEAVLALAEIQETWDAQEERWDPWQPESHRWERDEDGEWYEDEDEEEYDEPPPTGPDRYDLMDLIDSGITLVRWIDASGRESEPISTSVGGEEVCLVTPTSELDPYASEYEGYMGNYGNTMDRWYRRAAVVLWLRERAFAVRAEASPGWALAELRQRVEAGEIVEAREGVVAILPDWTAPGSRSDRLFADAARIAHALGSPELASSLLRPFRVEAITPAAVAELVALAGRYGEDWLRALLGEWSDADRRWTGAGDREWLTGLPALCEALIEAHGADGARAATILLEDRWIWLDEEIAAARGIGRPSLRAQVLADLAPPLLGWLEAAAVAEAEDLRAGAVSVLCAPENDVLLPWLVQVLRSAAESVAPERLEALGFEVLASHCAGLLEAGLALPPRSEDDWSIAPPPGCECELCATLEDFLADPEADELEWPIAKEKRRHVHGRLDGHELPVRHETRRKGSPYTLVLTKTRTLFEREAAERKRWQADLDWLSERL